MNKWARAVLRLFVLQDASGRGLLVSALLAPSVLLSSQCTFLVCCFLRSCCVLSSIQVRDGDWGIWCCSQIEDRKSSMRPRISCTANRYYCRRYSTLTT